MTRMVFNEEIWEKLSEMLPAPKGRHGGNVRLFLEAVCWIIRTGAPWRDLPPEYGNWKSGFCQISVLLEKPPQYLVLSAMLKYQLYVPFSFCDSHLTKPNIVYYSCLPRLLPALALARGDGSYDKKMKQLAKVSVLILDDWGLAPLTDEQRRDLLELLDDRHEKSSTIVTSQLPIKL